MKERPSRSLLLSPPVSASGTRQGAYSIRRAARVVYGVDDHWSRATIRLLMSIGVLSKVGRRKVCCIDVVSLLAYTGRDRYGRPLPDPASVGDVEAPW